MAACCMFDLPTMMDGNYQWTWTRYGVYVPEVRVTLATVPGDLAGLRGDASTPTCAPD